jgi:Predicted redox protein, regulator of disulfide bond formation
MIISESKNENYCTEISNQTTVVFSDVTEEKGGGGQYFRPHDLLCAGYASCLNITVRMVLDSKNIEYEKVIVKIDLDRSCEHKTRFLYDIDILGNIPDDIKQQIIKIASNCPVRKTLSKEIEFAKIEE